MVNNFCSKSIVGENTHIKYYFLLSQKLETRELEIPSYFCYNNTFFFTDHLWRTAFRLVGVQEWPRQGCLRR